MATVETKCMSVLTLFLLIVVIAFPLANAIPAKYIHKFCKETSEVAFCLKYIGRDPRTPAARDLSDLLLIAITQSVLQVDAAIIHIGWVHRKFSGPNGRRRIEVCKTDYGIALARFHTAWVLGLEKSFWDVVKLARIGTNAVIDCEDVWRRDGPVQKSPLTFYNMNVFKMSGIITLIIEKIISFADEAEAPLVGISGL